MKTVIYPGTFDPITNGHVDLMERATQLFDKVVLAIAYSEKKKPLLQLQQRIQLCEQALAHLDNIEVCGFNNLLVDFAASKNSHIVLRGLRTVADFEYEFQLAHMNRAMSPTLETVFLAPAENLTFISSSLVREIAAMNGDVAAFVPPVVLKALDERFKS